MGSSSELKATELLDAQAHLWNLNLSVVKSKCLKCAVDLGIAGAVFENGGPMTLDELVAAIGVRPTKSYTLYRVMRVLVHLGVFDLRKESDRDAYALNNVSRLLHSAKISALAWLDSENMNILDSLGAWFRNDDHTIFNTMYAAEVWDHLASNTEKGHIGDICMAEDSEVVARVVMERCKWMFEGLKSLVDVAGGTGTMGKAIAAAFPNMECTVLDQQHVVANLQGTKNLKFIGGNMFEEIPAANAILMKWVLHDWDDEESVKILKKCKEAIPGKEEGGKLIIIDMVVIDSPTRDPKSRETQFLFDVFMVMMGLERTEKQWAKLFEDAGFSSYKINPLLGLRSIIEVYP